MCIYPSHDVINKEKNEHYMESLISGNMDTKFNSKKAHENGYNSLKHKIDPH